ncbi:hypothetical protein B0H12DRAFT_624214 [Mycena haematopus]|nr:hypothetical protein B0H12DRAFT_624214 [Mycena haematopus]
MPPYIPPEIFSLICAEVVETCNLAVLCRTSQFSREEAQRILYHTVDLEGRGTRSVWSWAHAVTHNPRVAKRVHALSLQLAEDRKLEPGDLTKIQRALHACTNLKELKVSCDEINRPVSLHGWVLDEAPFQLTKFANNYFSSFRLGPFWNAQSEIRALSLSHSFHTSFTFADGQLPNLIALKALSWHTLPHRRPLQRLGTSFTRDFSPLAQYSQTLTTLNLVRESVDHDVTLFGTITNILALLPALLHFGIAELVKLVRKPVPHIHHLNTLIQPGVRLVERSPAARLKGFSKLETFFLLLRNEIRFYRPRSNLMYEMDYDKDVEDLAFSIMVSASPTLRRVVVGAEAEADREFTCTVTRDLNSEIHKTYATHIDLEAVSMFWKP